MIYKNFFPAIQVDYITLMKKNNQELLAKF